MILRQCVDRTENLLGLALQEPQGDVRQFERGTCMASTHDEISKTIPESSADPPKTPPATNPPSAMPAGRPSRPWRKWLIIQAIIAGLVAAGYFVYPAVQTALNTVSTDDAYVNGHVTFVAPRVSGQVSRVLVDDNYRVKKGALLVQLDKEPFEDQVAVKQAAVAAAEADLVAAQAQARGLAAQARADRFQLERAIEDVHTQLANLRANKATLKSRQATLELARNNLRRGEDLLPSGGISKEDLDQRREAVKVADATVDQAIQAVLATRVGLGLPAQTPKDHELSDVPDDLDQNFSAVRHALGQLIHSAALLGYAPPSWDVTPKQALEVFMKQDSQGNLDRIYAALISQAPAVKQAESKLQQARRDLVLAKLDLRYCDVASEIDGVVTRRNVNPGNNVQAGESLMAVRSLTEIWIDANFKETQLAGLRIGHRVRCEVDMYGLHYGDRSNPRLVAAAERHRQLCEDRPAAAGPRRANRLRSGQGPFVRRFVGCPLRVLQGTAHGGARRGRLATALPTSVGPNGS
jgi:membrane fusion protein, multidrug efflux system